MNLRLLTLLVSSCILLGCKSGQNHSPTFRTYDLYLHPKEQQRAQLKTIFESISKPYPKPSMVFDSGWVFSPGDSSEFLNANTIKKGGDSIHLPHRILLPDQSLWYSQQITIPAPGFLYLQADDGAQLFVNEKQVKHIESNYFSLDSGNVNLSVRVLNNAMAGGLRSVLFINENEMQRYQTELNLYLRLKRVIEKAVLINTISADQFEKIKQATVGWNETSISNAESIFHDYPYLVGPWLFKMNDHSFRLVMQADSGHEVTLRYGLAADQLNEIQNSKGTIITFSIPKETGKQVFYQLTSAKTISPVYHFETSENEKFSFNVWADSQGGWEKFQSQMNNMEKGDDAFGIGAGDLVSNGSDREEWMTFFNVLSISSPYRPYYLVAGNHDHDGYYDDLHPQLYHQYTQNFSPGYFGWNYGNCAFIALNPNMSFPIGVAKNTAQRIWFEKQIQSDQWKRATWRFILLHQAIYSQGWAGYHGDQVLRDLIEPVIESARVDFVISGHTHDYERLIKNYGQQRTTYLIVGGAGGSLEPSASSVYPRMDTVVKRHHMGRFKVDGKQINFEVFDIDNNRIDSLTILK